MTDPRSASLAAIHAAGLNPTTERNAARLLAQVAEENGGIVLTFDALCDIFDVQSRAVTRRHLGYMQAAGIIHYSTNEVVYINFRGWPATESARGDHQTRAWARADVPEAVPTDDQMRAPTRAEEPTETPESAPDLPKARVGDTESARGRALGGDNRGGMNERVLSSPLPGEIFIHSIRPEAEQKISLAILTDPAIRLGAWKARQIAEAYPFQTVRAYCCDYLAQGKRPLDDAGLIDWWLKNEPVPALVENELYRRHRTPEEIAAEQERETAAAEENRQWEERTGAALCPPFSPPPAAAPLPTPAKADEAADIWPAVLAQLASTMPAPTFEAWLRDTNLLGIEDGTYTVGAPHASAREYLQSRLKPQIQRAISRQANRTATVEFAVRSRKDPTRE